MTYLTPLKAGGVKTPACDKVRTLIEVSSEKQAHFSQRTVMDTSYFNVQLLNVAFG